VLVHGLRKSYQTHQAVDGIDLDIETKEIPALLVSNGAGKTATVEILTGKRQRDAGTVEDPANAAIGARNTVRSTVPNAGQGKRRG
jgi:ABC-2 type transport system ATP-binding protein